ncbi:bifunctional glutamate N-acetyltransferase/amino-acid acetyltransferase ArgJ [Oceanibacterium hippocampi]|uniref:Arginine biosynthesis bifunctional protein ArgJ n=1 Tax=Oceanibacterium hippocampi TaxID=745714 RepID=A0A1Y5RAF0_9PROT|nr:bifunctional glutamate N-acetyltransferase/amino-acid acetyltransferase ArgJ [Oceanibacterium hippocampi]SLN10113.1 Arginine biosynthesis bifunctional protein ArgJ [Oceanibacterium hippocampi]
MAQLQRSPLAPAGFPVLPAIAGVTLATGNSGIRYKGRDDVLFARFVPGTTVAGLLTRNSMPGAPVTWCRANLARGSAGALVVNAGNANVYTGAAGDRAVEETAAAAAKIAGCVAEDVYVASTGVIGVPLPAEKIAALLPALGNGEGDFEAAAKAICTTDTFPKGASATATIGGDRVTIAGIAKGSGMIQPDMATMLAFVFTDANLPAEVLDSILREANDRSFNAITVDSDTSTSDTLLAFATGRAGNRHVSDPADPLLDEFRAALEAVLVDLAKQVVRDGEGASKFITVQLGGAKDDLSARRIALSIANSPLVKTAIAGEDANWGRIAMAIGKSGEPIRMEAVRITIGGVQIAANGGLDPAYREADVVPHMKGQEIEITVDVGIGDGRATVWTCDLTHGYISINADYRS